jgi:ABC-type dipeptide/oligopeptide/nickel transport system permease component
MDMIVISFTGVVFIETVFQLPGLGTILYRSLISADLPVILGVTIVVSFTVVIMNMIADILYCIIDPRMSLRGPPRRGFSSRLRVGKVPQASMSESPTT